MVLGGLGDLGGLGSLGARRLETVDEGLPEAHAEGRKAATRPK